ncbi:MAG TPA: glycine C-acetyltransferase [Trueperaceae bacterium]|nr:glycine C-acetyltransferase [Trueperaceae bacterium]
MDRWQRFTDHLSDSLTELRAAGLEKVERRIVSPQGAMIEVATRRGTISALNLCANNYLGLADHPSLVQAGKEALDERGFGMASVRFICGTQDVHQELEDRLSAFLGTDDTILYSSCFDANGGLFETLLGEDDAIISDALNHASIIDGVRLSKAARYRYANNDMADLEKQLQAAAGARFRLIATDGVFSMDGIIADLEAICDLADQYDALVMVDDSHAVGFIGDNGRGSHEARGVMDRVDILTGTLGKALGGASGGFTSGRRQIIDWLRQRSRPYLFSNSIPPVVAATSLRVLDLLEGGSPFGSGAELRASLRANSEHFRRGMADAGFELAGAGHPIIPVMVHDAALAGRMADMLLEEGVYVVGFSYPVVPHGQARIRTQMSSAHTTEQLDMAVAAFTKVGRELGVVA